MATLVELRSQVGDITRDPNNRIRPTATVDRAINSAYQALQKDLENYIDGTNDTSTLTGVAGTQEYTLPTGLLVVQQVRRTENSSIRELFLTTKKNIQAIQTNTPATGTPTRYYLVGQGTIGLYPIPASGGTISINYTGLQATITTSVDSNNPALLDDAIAYKTVSILFKQVQKFQESAIRDIEYEKEVDSARLALRGNENRRYETQNDSKIPGDYSRQLIGY